MLFEFQNAWIFLGFTLDFSDIGLLDKDSSDTDFDLLETDIDSLPVHISLVSITSRRQPQDIS